MRQEFEDYLTCGLLEHGFLRVKCDGCRVLERRGLLSADPEHPSLDWVPDASLDHLQAASVS